MAGQKGKRKKTVIKVINKGLPPGAWKELVEECDKLARRMKVKFMKGQNPS